MPVQCIKLQDEYGLYILGCGAVHCHRCGGVEHIVVKCGGKCNYGKTAVEGGEGRCGKYGKGSKSRGSMGGARVNYNDVVHIAASLAMYGLRVLDKKEADAERLQL